MELLALRQCSHKCFRFCSMVATIVSASFLILIVIQMNRKSFLLSVIEDGKREIAIGNIAAKESLPDIDKGTSTRNQFKRRENISDMNRSISDGKTLNVHVVPHTHDDVGWLKTVDEYFWGRNTSIQDACVNDILDSVVSALLDNPFRTFTYVETKFFSMWWERQTDAVKESVRFLVSNNQLHFANGGWCMHDEATTHFMGMIDQTTLGHAFLKRELGVVPRVGWQLDPFGHSSTQASLLTSKVGFDALYFGRIDYQDLEIRKLRKDCEGLWDPSKKRNNDNDAETQSNAVFWGLTGSYGGNYGAPSGFCFDVNCKEDNDIFNDTPDVLKQKIIDFLHEIRLQSDQTRGNHIMLTMGSDFQYRKASKNFANLDILIGKIRDYQLSEQLDVPFMFGPRFERINVFYSSPEYYTECKYKELQTGIPRERNNFASTNSSTNTVNTKEGKEEMISYSLKKDDFFSIFGQ